MDDLPDKKQKKRKPKQSSSDSGLSRRDFLKLTGASAAAPLMAGAAAAITAAPPDSAVQGPGKVPVSLNVNGKKLSAQLEPRVTLLDALRDELGLTGAKEGCGSGDCGACSVMVDGRLRVPQQIQQDDAGGGEGE